MDVRCNRCGTEYDFDDALISERGTTVKCTNCGLQFKVYPQHQSSGPERWVVRTAQGRELVFTSLRDLQRGIADRKVDPEDMLTRGQRPPRPLSSITELEPFFQTSWGRAAAAAASTVDRAPRTLHGVAPPANSMPAAEVASAEAAPLASRESEHAEAPRMIHTASGSATADSPMSPEQLAMEPPAFPPAPRAAREALLTTAVAGTPGAATLPAAPSPTGAVSPPAPGTAPHSGTMPLDDYDRARREAGRSSPFGSRVPLETVPRSSPYGSARATLDGAPRSSPYGSPRAPLESSPRSSRGGLDVTPRPPISSRGSFHSYDELTTPAIDRAFEARRARSRWIVGVVALGIVGLVAATAGRRYLAGATVPSAAPAATNDGRVQALLRRGNQLADEGDYEAAQEELVKASALAEKDPHVLAALARLETLRADMFWLKLRLLDPSSTELVAATHRELGRRVGKARQAADRAFAAAPEDPVVIRARVDSMRLSGESDKAREWIAPVSSNGSQPENAFALAALDLSDPSPVWASVVDRLRTAASGEREPGRARAALIYALARADRVEDARAELTKLEAQPKPHPLLEELRGFLARFGSAAPGAAASASSGVVDPSKLPQLDTSAGDERDAAVPRDFRAALTNAATALRSGNLSRAETLYGAALADQPRNVEALAGLADVARRRGDGARAAQLYDQVLALNPSYLPALIASADQNWAAGNRTAAVTLYRRIVDQAGTSSEYGARAQARINESAPAPAPGTEASPSPPTESAAPPASAPPPPDAPHIDTTDLPGMQ